MDERKLLLRVEVAAQHLLAQELTLPSPEARAAWRELQASVADCLVWRLVNDAPYGTRIRWCQRCGRRFFFALLPTGRFVALELEPLEAGEVVPAWRYVVDFCGEPVRAEVQPGTDLCGYVYVDHGQTCGASDGPGCRYGAYARRYRVNVARAVRLRDMQRRLVSAVEPEGARDDG